MCSFEYFQERQVHSNQDFLPLLATSRLGVLDWDLWCIWAFLLYMGIMLYICFVTDCQRRRLFGFEFVMLANHDKTWQKLSLIGLEWSTLKSKTKNSSSGWKKMSYKLFHFIGTRSIENCISTKISKRKKPITWPFWSPNREPFFPIFKEHYKLTLGGGFFRVF